MAEASFMPAWQILLAMLRAANGGAVSRRMLEAGLRSRGHPISPRILLDGIRAARRHTWHGEHIAAVNGFGYRLTDLGEWAA